MMTEQLTTIARPYALAAFEYAVDKHDLPGWSAMLRVAALIAEDKKIKSLLSSSAITKNQLAELFCDVIGKTIDAEKKNFIYLLAESDRLLILPEIEDLFTAYRQEFEKTISVQLVSAVPLDKAYEQKFIDALTRRLKRKVELHCEVDSSLLGGAMIRAGDKVIDGSIRGKLNRLIEFI
jgi:F-type H+-transporting ATPase subunit delta